MVVREPKWIKILVRNYKQTATLGDKFTILLARGVGFPVQVLSRQTKSITKISKKETWLAETTIPKKN